MKFVVLLYKILHGVKYDHFKGPGFGLYMPIKRWGLEWVLELEIKAFWKSCGIEREYSIEKGKKEKV